MTRSIAERVASIITSAIDLVPFNLSRKGRTEWELCSCPWFYDVTINYEKKRGKIPGATTLDEARTKYQLIAARLRNGQPAFEPVDPTPTGITVSQLGDEWLRLPRKRKPSVIETYRKDLDAHILPVIGSKLVTEVTPADCESLVLGMKRCRGDKPLSNSTRKKVARALHALFSFAAKPKQGYRANNPAVGLQQDISDPATDATADDPAIDPKDHTKYFTSEEAAHLLATCRTEFPKWYPFVLTALQTGMRMGELVALRYDRINWRGGYIVVDRAWVRGQITTPKNGKRRTVTISRDLRAVLYLRWRQHRTSELVFPSDAATHLDSHNFRNKPWTRLLRAAELDYRKPHAMRHTHDSLLLQAGKSPVKVAEESGRTVAETMKTYAHFLPGGNRDEAETLAGILNGTNTTTPKVVDTVSTNGLFRVRKGNDRHRPLRLVG